MKMFQGKKTVELIAVEQKIINNLPLGRIASPIELLGYAICLLLWQQKTLSAIYEKIVSTCINVAFLQLSVFTPVSFANGLLGVGWLVEYMLQKNLVIGDADTILEDIDNRVSIMRWDMLEDFGIESGLQGVLLYISARIRGCIIRNQKFPFSNSFCEVICSAIQRGLKKECITDIPTALLVKNYLKEQTDVTDINPCTISDINMLCEDENWSFFCKTAVELEKIV